MSGKDLMLSVVAAFEKSDIAPLLNALHDDVVWKSAFREESPFRFKGDFKKREGATIVLANISKDYTFQSLTPREIVEDGDVVWGLFDAGLRYDAKGEGIAPKDIKLEIAIRWRLKDGKIIEHQAFFDTAHLFLQQGGGKG